MVLGVKFHFSPLDCPTESAIFINIYYNEIILNFHIFVDMFLHFLNLMLWTVVVQMLSHVHFFVTPWTAAHQACKLY